MSAGRSGCWRPAGTAALLLCAGSALAEDRHAWDGLQPAPVGSLPPNPFGLHDRLGNVREWVEGCYSSADAGAHGACRQHTGRGGGWSCSGGYARAGNRYAGQRRQRRAPGLRVTRSD